MFKQTFLFIKVLELNASDDRGIGIVRGQVLTFASTRTIFKKGYKLIILDEADAMTRDAQNALRRSKHVHIHCYMVVNYCSRFQLLKNTQRMYAFA